jgi:hypothetical protein
VDFSIVISNPVRASFFTLPLIILISLESVIVTPGWTLSSNLNGKTDVSLELGLVGAVVDDDG